MKVSDVMSADIVTVGPDTSLKQAALIMLQHGVSGLPVIDAAAGLVGIVTEADFLHQEATHDFAHRYRLLDPIFGRGEAALTSAEKVADVMTTPVHTIGPDERLVAAARLMMDRNVKRLPVMDDRGRLVGMVSRTDVMRAFARPDDEIAAEIRAFVQAVPLGGAAIEVSVSGGVVRLAGELDSRVEAMALADLVERVEGVVRVENDLVWAVDESRPEQRFPGYSQEGAES